MTLWFFGLGITLAAARPESPDRLSLLKRVVDGRAEVTGFTTVKDKQASKALAARVLDAKRTTLVPVSSCEELREQLDSLCRPRQLGAGEFPLQLATGVISFGPKRIVDGVFEQCAAVRNELKQGTWIPTDFFSIRYGLLSLVGPVLTVSRDWSGAQGGGAPHHQQTWRTFDLRTGEAAQLSQWVEEKSLLEAFRGDAVIQKLLVGDPEGQTALAKSTTLTLLGVALDRVKRDREDFNHFAFGGYDAKRDRVAVRIAFHADKDSCGMCSNAVSQLGLWVKPAASLRPYLQEASLSSAQFMGKDPSGKALRCEGLFQQQAP